MMIDVLDVKNSEQLPAFGQVLPSSDCSKAYDESHHFRHHSVRIGGLAASGAARGQGVMVFFGGGTLWEHR